MLDKLLLHTSKLIKLVPCCAAAMDYLCTHRGAAAPPCSHRGAAKKGPAPCVAEAAACCAVGVSPGASLPAGTPTAPWVTQRTGRRHGMEYAISDDTTPGCTIASINSTTVIAPFTGAMGQPGAALQARRGSMYPTTERFNRNWTNQYSRNERKEKQCRQER